MKGYFFKLLNIDVTERTFRVEDIDRDLIRQNLGGKGLATRLLLDNNPAGIDPLGPENSFIISSGPLSGSSLFGSSRYGVFAKSPLTGFFGESYSGGNFASPLAGTGFDAVIITGASDTPLWLEIVPGKAIFHDASELWGMDSFGTESYLRQNSMGKNPGVMVIGPAGENLVRFAVIKNDEHRVAGRTGMGAVLGSKKIKGISCSGDRKKIFHDNEGIRNYKKKMFDRYKDSPVVKAYKTMGTPMMVDVINAAGAFPTGYWKEGYFEKKDSINAAAMAARIAPSPHACRDCFLGCGKKTRVLHGRHRGLQLEGPEYETIYAFGGLCMIDEIEEIAYLNRLCDSLGMDTISSGNLASLVIEGSESGKIDEKFSYGSSDHVGQLIEKTAARQGIGDILAEGIKSASEKLDMEDISVHVKGMEPAGYDPRAIRGMGLAYAVSERGACHLRTTFYKAELSSMLSPDASARETVDLFMDFEDRCTVFDSFILCRFFRDLYPWQDLSRLLYLSSGMELDMGELKSIAGHIKDNTRRFNLKEGLTPSHDTLPERLFSNRPEDEGGITRAGLKELVSRYYTMRGWDSQGVPLNR